MSNSKGRIRKLSDPFKKNPLNDNNYRRAKKYLELETGSRCCYSMQHKDLALGDVGMEVEHFKPKKKFPRKANAYKNLLYASRHCNNSKNDNWPNPSQRKKGLRFINPSTEMDYGVHIFEDIKSGK